jgi:flavin-dependent dehydrogenase
VQINSSPAIDVRLIGELLEHKMAQQPPPPPKTILVIGGGLGGLAFAQILQNSSVADKYKVIVFERDPKAGERAQGYRIGINRPGQSALASVPTAVQFLAAVEPKPKGGLMVDSKLKLMMSIKDDASNPNGSIVGVVNRWGLRDALVAGVSVEYGKAFERYEETDTHVVAYFKDGTQATGDLLVGADGAKSRVRAQRCPEMKLEDVAVQVVAASVAATPALKAKMARLVDLLQGAHFVRGMGAKGSCLMLMEFNGTSGQEMFFWAYSFPLHVAPNLPTDAEALKPVRDLTVDAIGI